MKTGDTSLKPVQEMTVDEIDSELITRQRVSLICRPTAADRHRFTELTVERINREHAKVCSETCATLLDALRVITLTPETVAYLEEHDPKALLQARQAIEFTTGQTVASQASLIADCRASRLIPN